MKEGRQRIFYGYVVIAAATFILTIAWGANRTFGVFLDPMLDEFGWTRAGISGAYTLATVIMGAISIVAGGLMDRFGPRVVMIGCGVFLSSSYLLMAQISSISQMYLKPPTSHPPLTQVLSSANLVQILRLFRKMSMCSTF